MNLLIIDDDKDLLKLLKLTFEKEYNVVICDSALKIEPSDLCKYDLIILDIMMEEMSGFEFLTKYRNMIDIPIILLTAKDFEKDKVEGFALGADDYVTKPFSVAEIRARVAAHIRRENREKHSKLIDYPISCDLLSKKIYFDNVEISFTNSEYEICEFLLKNKNQVFSKEKIYTAIYGYDKEGDSSTTITERIKLIRSKFEPILYKSYKNSLGSWLSVGNKKSLRYLISKYVIMELVYSFFIVVLFYVGLNVLLNTGVVYPANYADIQSEKVETGFQTEDWTLAEIPYYYDFLYLKDGKIIENTIDKKYDDLVQQAIKNGRAISGEIIGSNIFKAYTRGNRQLVIRYRVNVIFANEKLYKIFENFEWGYIVFILMIWFFGFALLLIRSSNILKREIYKIAMANDNISQMNLDYEREHSKYKEIDGVLRSIDVLAENLKKSLGEQWDMQVKQKELVEQLTHDIRTPITLIKGNLELLKEEHRDVSSERFADISNGIDRLEKYIEKLKKFSYTMEGKKDVVSNEVILYWIEVMSSICRLNGLTLEVIKSESSNIKLDKEEVAVALQNIVTNAVEYSKKGSKIMVAFKDEPSEFILTVRDEGMGFDKDLLPLLTEKFISGKVKDKCDKHGLGLWGVKNIVVANNGNLYLKNYSGRTAGAEVKMVFNKE